MVVAQVGTEVRSAVNERGAARTAAEGVQRDRAIVATEASFRRSGRLTNGCVQRRTVVRAEGGDLCRRMISQRHQLAQAVVGCVARNT